MRPPAQIKAHTTVQKMFLWLQSAPDEWTYKRRMAVWLTYTGKLNARQVANVLGVSTQSVWLWVHQYNRMGPDGLNRKGRGGRRRSCLTPAEETALLRPFMDKTRNGLKPRPSSLKSVIEDKIGRPVSMSYVYRLLARHRWSDVIAQSQAAARPVQPPTDYRKYAMPWLNRDPS